LNKFKIFKKRKNIQQIKNFLHIFFSS